MGLLSILRRKARKALPGYQGSRIWSVHKKVERSRPVQKATRFFREGQKRKLADQNSLYAKWVKYSEERIKQIEQGKIPKDVYAKAFAVGALEFLKEAEIGGEAQKYVDGAILALQAYLAFSAAKDYVKAEKARKRIEENLAALRRKQEEDLSRLRRRLEIAEGVQAGERPFYTIERLPQGGYMIVHEKDALMKYAATLDTYGAILLSELETKKRPVKLKKKVKVKKVKKVKKPTAGYEQLFYTVLEKSPHYAEEMMGVMKHIVSHPEKYPRIVVQSAEKVLSLGEAVGLKPAREISPSEHFRRMLQFEDLFRPTGQLQERVDDTTSLTIIRTLAELGRKRKRN